MQHLYDADGRAYLDAVNNVPHVGHCHPRVVEAGQRQMAVLNTNTRYLHERLVRVRRAAVRHAARPAARLLLRQLRQRGQRTRAPARPRLHRQPRDHRGGRRATTATPTPSSRSARTSSTAPAAAARRRTCTSCRCPTCTAGIYRERSDAMRARRYAAHVAEAVERIAGRGGRVGAFIAESILSCGGQIVLPPGYLRAAYEAVRGPRAACASPTRCRWASGAWARTSGRSKRRASCPTSSRWASPSATGTRWAPSSRRRRSRARSRTAWSTSTPTAAIPCRAPSAWPCWT